MTNNTLDELRAAFEASRPRDACLAKHEDGRYINPNMEFLWVGYQAGHKPTLEKPTKNR